jgi:L-lactate dehydrogenase (cytochrome)
MTAISVDDFRGLARRRLPRFLFDYIDGGAFREVTLDRNLADLADLSLRQKVLRDVSAVDLSTTLLGEKLDMPVVLGPVGLAGLAARRGEVQALRAATAAGIPFCLSTVSACSLAEVRAGATQSFWFQLYMMRDRGFMRDLLAQAAEASCSALVFTVDMPVPGTRYRDRRSGLAGAPGLVGDLRRFWQAMMRPDWALDVGLLGRPHGLGNVAPLLGRGTGLEDFFAWMRDNFDSSVTWKDLDWVRSQWAGPLVIKGVLDEDDARAVAAMGAEGLVVSNHGGRQLDGAPSPIRALPDIVQAVGDQLTILADGGVRSGLDVVKLMALGARGVLLGRAWAFALGARGEAGVAQMLTLIADEMRVTMALVGATRPDQLNESVLFRDGFGRPS